MVTENFCETMHFLLPSEVLLELKLHLMAFHLVASSNNFFPHNNNKVADQLGGRGLFKVQQSLTSPISRRHVNSCP